MSRKPYNVQWLGFNQRQIDLLDNLDYVGDNGWAHGSQPEDLQDLMMGLIETCEAEDLNLDTVKQAMRPIGYPSESLQQLDYRSKRLTEEFYS